MVGLALELGAMLVAAKAKMEKDAHGRQYPLNEIYGCPWHEASAKCVITEVLP